MSSNDGHIPSDFWSDDPNSVENYEEKNVTTDLIKRVEKKLGYKLPDSYVDLMRSQNGGIPVKNCFPLKNISYLPEGYISIEGIFGIGKNKKYSLLGPNGNPFIKKEEGFPDIGIYFGRVTNIKDTMLVLDYRKSGSDGEPVVLLVDKSKEYILTFVSNDFKSFIENLSERADLEKEQGIDEEALQELSEEYYQELLETLEVYHDENKHEKIILIIEKIPREKWNYKIRNHYGRALNNVSRYEEALTTFLTDEEEGKSDPLWNYRVAYSLFYIEGREKEALTYIEKSLELSPDTDFIQEFHEMITEFLKPIIRYEADEIEALQNHITKHFGTVEHFFEEISSVDIRLNVLIIDPTPERNFYTLVTLGMGARKMNVPEEFKDFGVDRSELIITLPPDWQISNDDEKWYWPVRCLKSIGRIPTGLDTWIARLHTVANQNPPQPYAENTQLCSTFITLPFSFGSDSYTCELPNGEFVRFYQLFPIYEAELNFIYENSSNDFENLMRSREVDMTVNINRKMLISN
jgi:tetratricopeptide (TPR) repeat protein